MQLLTFMAETPLSGEVTTGANAPLAFSGTVTEHIPTEKECHSRLDHGGTFVGSAVSF